MNVKGYNVSQKIGVCRKVFKVLRKNYLSVRI
jgi:hypothetical protein